MKALFRAALAVTLAGGMSGAAGATGAARLHRMTAATSAPAGWASTQNVGLTFNAPDLGVLSATTPMHVTLGLKGNMAGAVAALAHIYKPGDPLYHKFLTPAQFTAQFAPPTAAASAAASYLTSMGMQNVSVTPNNLLVNATANAATVSRAFNTTLHAFNFKGKLYYANVTPALVPASLAGSVASVMGLESLPLQRNIVGGPLAGANLANATRLNGVSFAKLRAASLLAGTTASTTTTAPPNCNNEQLIVALYGDYVVSTATGTSPPLPTLPIPNAPLPFCYPGSFTPTQYRLAYDDQANPVNKNTVIADYTSSCVQGPGCISDMQNDLYTMDVQNGLPLTNFVVKNIGGTTTDTSGEGEWDLDTQIAVGIGGGAPQEYLYNAGDGTGSGVPNVISAFATDDVAKFLNFSIGETETLAYLSGELQTTDFAAAEAALQGQTITVSSGDEGSFGGPGVNGVPVGVPGINYPCDSPYVMCVGGTSVLANATNGTYDSEISWYSGGGGISNYEPQSPWQNAMMQQLTNGPMGLVGLGYGPGTRLVPDIAMNADLDTGMLTYVSGVEGQYGGTSLAAPMAEGVLARIQSASGNTWGDLTPALYMTYVNHGGGIAACAFNNGVLGSASSPAGCAVQTGITPNNIGGLNDIVLGENDLYTALPGYDLNTGMGTLDINQLFINFGE
jgi:subtilase family serine protease